MNSLRQTQLLIDLADEAGFEVRSPRAPGRRGGTVTIHVPDFPAVHRELAEREILCDFRPDAGIRLGPHYYTSDDELRFVVEQIGDILETGAHTRTSASRRSTRVRSARPGERLEGPADALQRGTPWQRPRAGGIYTPDALEPRDRTGRDAPPDRRRSPPTPGIEPDELEQYGRHKAKVDLSILDRLADRPDGKIVNVTAITPTPPGEGKTTTSVALTQGLGAIGRSVVLALREASLGPVFGVKGGAAGGGLRAGRPDGRPEPPLHRRPPRDHGREQPLAALIDAHLLHGNALGLDPLTITWRRCLDMNDRSLRDIVTGLGGRVNGLPRQTGFDITAASEVMAVVASRATSPTSASGWGASPSAATPTGEPVTAEELGAAGAMTVLLKEALKPNLVQTLEGQPAFVHCGPFANIAHGNNSLVADRVG